MTKFTRVPEERIERNATERCWLDGWKVAAMHNEGVEDWYKVAVYENTENCSFAAYWQGDLLCMLKHLGTGLKVDVCYGADDFNKALLKMHQDEAVEAGFPMCEPCFMTWRDIRDALEGMDDEHLDKHASMYFDDSYHYIERIDSDEEDPDDTMWFEVSDR